jgi:hypothetical protein
MSRRMTASVFFLVGLLAVAAAEPPDSGAGSGPDKKVEPEKKKPDATDSASKAALANDPDVQVARAKVQLAEAEMAKAKQAVVIKVMSALANIQELKSSVEQNQEQAAWADRMVKSGQLTQTQAQADRAKLESAKAALARAETELKLFTGGGKEPGPESDLTEADVGVHLGLLLARKRNELFLNDQSSNTLMALAALYAVETKAPVGAVPDRIRAALDKPVKLGARGDRVTFEQALEVFKKDAGLDVPVRVNLAPHLPPPEITSQGEELPVGAWLQLYMDVSGGAVLTVREYGLLFTPKSATPPGAPTIVEFWKQKPPDSKNLEDRLAALKHKRAELSTKYGASHPEIVALDRQIEVLEKELKDRADKPKK